MTATNTTDTMNVTNQITPAQLAELLTAAAQALAAQQPPAAAPAANGSGVGADAGAGASADAAGAAGANTAPAPGADAAQVANAVNMQVLPPIAPTPDVAPANAQAAAASASDPEQLALLRKIDTNVTDLSGRLVSVEKAAIRNGAIAGGVAGSVSGGIIAAGIAFVRAHLGA